MKLLRNKLALLYARAFFRLYGQVMDQAFVHSVERLMVFLRERPLFLEYFKMRAVLPQVKIDAMKEAFKRSNAPEQLNGLIDLLGAHGRLWLIVVILDVLVEVWYEHHHYVRGTISSWPEINNEEMVRVQEFFLRKTGYHLVAQTAVDQSLIAGIRITTPLHMWERSVRKTLAAFKRLAEKE